MSVTQLSHRAAHAPAGPHQRAPHGRPGLRGPATVDLTVVIPFYNGGAALRRTVLAVIDNLQAADVRFEVVAVDDGSTDGSADTIRDLAPVRVLAHVANLGKGAALRRGFAAAGGTWIGFIDADGDIDPHHLVDYLRRAHRTGTAGVYADKRHAHSGSAATGLRKVMSLAYSTFVSSLFGLEIRDTQTGCKIFRRDVVARLLPLLQERGFAIDLEFFVVARHAGITDFVAAPVALQSRVHGSTVCCKAVLRTVANTFAVYRRHRLGRHRNRHQGDLGRENLGPEVLAPENARGEDLGNRVDVPSAPVLPGAIGDAAVTRTALWRRTEQHTAA